MKISIIVAMGNNNVIGVGGAIPWRLPSDLARFKKITSGHAVIMGRKTHESIGCVLPDRDNIVLSRDPDYFAEGCINACGMTEALDYCNDNRLGECFIIGGAEIYKQALNVGIVDKIYLTKIDKDFKGDTFFPELDTNKLIMVDYEFVCSESFDYEFVTYEVLK